CSASVAAAWHERPGVDERLAAPWRPATMRERLRVLGSVEHAHSRRLLPDGEACMLEDRVEWRTALRSDAWARKELGRVFAWRHRVTRGDLERAHDPVARALAVGVTGASGFLGRALCTYLTTRGHRAVRF